MAAGGRTLHANKEHIWACSQIAPSGKIVEKGATLAANVKLSSDALPSQTSYYGEERSLALLELDLALYP
eukprot:1147345-Pelagomonas_calceolata.AAC.5